jgi:hypothetical protein
MASATPPPRATPPPPAPRPSAPAPAAPIPRSGRIDDRGVARHDAIHAAEWRVRGAAKVLQEADAGRAWLDGTVTVGGPLTADELTARGMLYAESRVDVKGALDVHADLEVAGPLHAGDATLRGAARIGGPVTIDRGFSVVGTLDAPSIAAQIVSIEGGIESGGPIVAGSVTAVLDRDSRLGTVRARSASLRGRVPNVVEKVMLRSFQVRVDRVEADAVTLEGVDVDFVRSPAIVLGRAAHVTTVEGTIVSQHPSADVGPRSRTPPPHGLRR